VASASAANPITALRVYVDNQAAYTIQANHLDTYLPMAKGSHFLVFQAWDSKGNVFKTARTISVQ